MMADRYDEINLLVNDILEGRAGKESTADRINALKKKYGDDMFPGIIFQKEPKPWDEGYMAKLKEKNITGACSEEFLLHMAEVSEELAAQKKRLIWGAIAAAGLLILAIILFALV